MTGPVNPPPQALLPLNNTWTGLNTFAPSVSASSGSTGNVTVGATINNSGTAAHTSLSIAPTLTGLGSGTNLGLNVTAGHANLTGQLRLGYDASNYLNFSIASNGNTTLAVTGGGGSLIYNPAGQHSFQTGGTTRAVLQSTNFASNTSGGFRLALAAAGASSGFIPNNTALNASVSASAAGNVTTYASNGTGGAAVNALDVSYNTVTLGSGVALKLGNAYQAGDPTTTGYLLVTDSTGTVYRIPAMAN